MTQQKEDSSTLTRALRLLASSLSSSLYELGELLSLCQAEQCVQSVHGPVDSSYQWQSRCFMVQCFQKILTVSVLKTSTWLTVLYAQNFAITERQLYSNMFGVLHLTHYDPGKVLHTSFTSQTSNFQYRLWYISLIKVAKNQLLSQKEAI